MGQKHKHRGFGAGQAQTVGKAALDPGLEGATSSTRRVLGVCARRAKACRQASGEVRAAGVWSRLLMGETRR